MELHLKITGLLLIILSLVHVFFPKYFRWRTELSGVSLINKQMMYVHTLFIGLTVFLMGMLCLNATTEMMQTRLGNKLSLALFIFWGTRFFVQFFGYAPALWKGKKLETLIHIVFAILWTYISIVFFVVYWFNNSL